MSIASTANPPRVGAAVEPAAHEDRTAFSFLLVAGLFFVVSGLVAIIIAAMYW